MKPSNVLLLVASLGAPAVLALPQSKTRPSPERSRCDANDVEMYTRDNWDKKKVDKWFKNWRDDNDDKDSKTDDAFAAYWGLGESFVCEIDMECDPQKCTDMNRPEQSKDYEKAHMVLTSMSNFNQYCVRLFNALDGANLDVVTMKEYIQQTFYPGVSVGKFAGLQGLSAMTAVVGIAAAWMGPLGVVTVTAAANSFKEVVAGVARGFSATMTKSDMSLKVLSEMGSDVRALFDDALDTLETEHNSLLEKGSSEGTDAVLEDLFAGGVWVEKDQIPVLNDVSAGRVRDYFGNMTSAMMINKAWKEQGTYIISREMDKDECEEFEALPDNPKLCVGGRGYWLVRHEKANFSHSTGVTVPPGASELKKLLGFNAEDVMRSSIDAFNEGGYKFDPDSLLDGNLLLDPQGPNVNSGGAFKGIFNLPICYPESSEQFSDTDLDKGNPYWRSFLKNYPDENGKAMQACLCSTVKDAHGVSIMDIEDSGSGSFRALMDDAGKCDLEEGALIGS